MEDKEALLLTLDGRPLSCCISLTKVQSLSGFLIPTFISKCLFLSLVQTKKDETLKAVHQTRITA